MIHLIDINMININRTNQLECKKRRNSFDNYLCIYWIQFIHQLFYLHEGKMCSRSFLSQFILHWVIRDYNIYCIYLFIYWDQIVEIII